MECINTTNRRKEENMKTDIMELTISFLFGKFCDSVVN